MQPAGRQFDMPDLGLIINDATLLDEGNNSCIIASFDKDIDLVVS
jgi:hypothetical protein